MKKYFDLAIEKLSLLWSMWLVIMLVASWSIYIQDGQINRDGLLYLKQAYLISEGSWKDGLAMYPWPLFSILIAVFHKLTNLHLQVSAHGVDLALFGVATLFYLKILKLICKEKQIIFYGGIILLSFIPIMDDYIGMVLRDHGLWAGCILGTYFYLKNIKKYSLKYSLAWQFGFLFSGLFRPEGLIFLILLPLWNLTHNKNQNYKNTVLDYSLIIFLCFLGLFLILFFNEDLLGKLYASRLSEFYNRPIQFLDQLIKPLPLESKNKYLTILLEKYSLVFTYSVLISILIFKWIKGLGLLHGGLLVYSHYAKKKVSSIFQKHIYFFLVVSFILVSVNLFNFYVLTNRYWVFHWWWLLIILAQITLIIFEDKKINSFIKSVLGVALAFCFLTSLVDKEKNIENITAQYLKENQFTQVDFKKNYRIKYYVNYDVYDLLNNQSNKSGKSPMLYSLYKIDQIENLESKLIVKKFPDIKPKFVLIQNDK